MRNRLQYARRKPACYLPLFKTFFTSQLISSPPKRIFPDPFDKEAPQSQEFLTKHISRESEPVDWANYQQNTLTTFNPDDIFDASHGILNYFFSKYNGKINFDEIEFHFSGATLRKDINNPNITLNLFDKCDIASIFDFNNIRSCFLVPSMANAFFGFTFKNIKVQPLFYTIQSDLYPRSKHLVNWVFEGFDQEENEWFVLDEKMNCQGLETGQFMTCICENTNKWFSSFRIRQININQNNDWGFSFSAMEIHGHVSLINDPDFEAFQTDFSMDFATGSYDDCMIMDLFEDQDFSSFII